MTITLVEHTNIVSFSEMISIRRGKTEIGRKINNNSFLTKEMGEAKKAEEKAMARYTKLMRKHRATITSVDELLNPL